MKGADLNGSSYRYFPSVKVNASQTLDVVWYSDIFLAGYIFSQEQFNHFQSVFPEIKQDGNKMTLEQENGITYEATGWASKYGEVSYNVTQSGDYVAVLTNVMSGGHFAGVGYFNESAITYSHQTEYVTEVQNLPQNDNLYLYLGSGFIIAGVAVILVFQRTQKAPFQEIKTNILKLIS
jgi:hypothetical protein